MSFGALGGGGECSKRRTDGSVLLRRRGAVGGALSVLDNVAVATRLSIVWKKLFGVVLEGEILELLIYLERLRTVGKRTRDLRRYSSSCFFYFF